MKGKITIVLLSLVLVFGMIAASCDDGAFPEDPYKNDTKNSVTDLPKPLPNLWADTAGMTTGITPANKAKFEGGIVDLTDTSDSALFTVAAPTATATSTITITYICKVKAGDPKVIIKNKNWGNATGAADNLFPTLEVNKIATLVVKGAGWPSTGNAGANNPATDISFQRNGDSNQFMIKITKVDVVTPTSEP
jgi:hypothetical protein